MGGFGDVTTCNELPVNGRRGGRGAAAVCQNPWEFGVREGRGGAATSCRILLGCSRNSGEMLGNMAEILQQYILHLHGCIPSHVSPEPWDRSRLRVSGRSGIEGVGCCSTEGEGRLTAAPTPWAGGCGPSFSSVGSGVLLEF